MRQDRLFIRYSIDCFWFFQYNSIKVKAWGLDHLPTRRNIMVNVRKQSHVEAFARLGFYIVGHGWDSLGGFVIMKEA